MQLPRLENPERYAGLYVVDFGDTIGVGYTAEEVAFLLESEQYAAAKAYRIHGARPDGTMELLGVPHRRFLLEAGLMFYRRDLDSARDDFARLRELGRRDPLPCRAQLFLASLPEAARMRFVVGLAYPSEYDQDVSRWMLDHQVTPGEYADGGIGRLEDVRRMAVTLDSTQLHAAGRRSRTRQEVFAAVGQPIQRAG